MTELNETTPSGKETSENGDEQAQEPKEIACKLFDTPSTETKRGTRGDAKTRDSVDLPADVALRSVAKSNSDSVVSNEPDDEDDVGDKVDGDATVISAKKPRAQPASSKTKKSAAKADTKKETEAAAKKALAVLADVSSDALDALTAESTAEKVSLCACRKRCSFAMHTKSSDILVCVLLFVCFHQKPTRSAKRKRGESPHEATTESVDDTLAKADTSAMAPAASKSKKAKATTATTTATSKSKSEDASVEKITAASASSSATKKSASNYVFLLTGSREESAINESIIAALGGTASRTGRKFDHSSTHIICSELKRTEKFVAGCAGGKVRSMDLCWSLLPCTPPHMCLHDAFFPFLVDPQTVVSRGKLCCRSLCGRSSS